MQGDCKGSVPGPNGTIDDNGENCNASSTVGALLPLHVCGPSAGSRASSPACRSERCMFGYNVVDVGRRAKLAIPVFIARKEDDSHG